MQGDGQQEDREDEDDDELESSDEDDGIQLVELKQKLQLLQQPGSDDGEQQEREDDGNFDCSDDDDGIQTVVWLNISPRPLFHITSIYFESKSGRRQSAVIVTVERAASIVGPQSS